MKIDALLKDPVFQLNLLLWMAKEQSPTGYRVHPFFHGLGFSIIYIEQPFAFPDQTAKAIQELREAGLDIGIAPEPDLILGRKTDNKALYIEAKANSFGSASTNCRQARAHLVASGPAFGEVLSPLASCLLCYVVPDEKRSQMSQCLTSLTNELKDKGLQPGPFSSQGLAINGAQLIYSWDSVFKTHVGVSDDKIPIPDDITQDTDPVPLVLVFSDEDCSNDENRDFYRQVVINQARACLLCDLHSHSIGAPYTKTPEDLLVKTTDNIFRYLGRERQNRLRRLIRENLFKKIRDSWKDKQSGITLNRDSLVVTWNTTQEKEQFLGWLEDRRTKFNAGKPSGDDLPLLAGHGNSDLGEN